jgi:hypothetical protein
MLFPETYTDMSIQMGYKQRQGNISYWSTKNQVIQQFIFKANTQNTELRVKGLYILMSSTFTGATVIVGNGLKDYICFR